MTRKEELLQWFFAEYWGIDPRCVQVEEQPIGDQYIVGTSYFTRSYKLDSFYVFVDGAGPFIAELGPDTLYGRLLRVLFVADTTDFSLFLRLASDILE